MATYRRLTEPARQSFFLLGMRGVGKSTWARATFPDAAYVDLLDERLYQDLLADPSLFAQSVGHLPPGAWVVVDEVQRLPALLNEVHRLIETRRLRFALLGSSARKLKAAGTNLLAGRALKRTMFPLTAAELGAEFDLERVLRHGSVPLVWTSDAPRAVLETYAQLYLREEIRAEALVRNLPGFVRFLPVAALFNGQIVNVAGPPTTPGCACANGSRRSCTGSTPASCAPSSASSARSRRKNAAPCSRAGSSPRSAPTPRRGTSTRRCGTGRRTRPRPRSICSCGGGATCWPSR